jgi:chromosome segregation ATPase
VNLKAVTGIALGSAVAGLVLGLVLGMRGCDDGSVTKLLEENAELKVEVTRQRFLAHEAEKKRADHAVRRNDAERELAAMVAVQAETVGTVKVLRAKVKAAGRKRDERNELIDALEMQNAVQEDQIDWVQAALDASKDETVSAIHGRLSLDAALVASEKRADMLEKRVMKERPKRVLIGVGSAIGASLLTLGATYAAGKL